jgi:rubrerythrin
LPNVRRVDALSALRACVDTSHFRVRRPVVEKRRPSGIVWRQKTRAEESMDILDYAMKMEKDGEDYYREQEAKVKDPNAARFLGILAREEVRHYEIFRQLKQGVKSPLAGTFTADVRTLFQEMKAKGESFRDTDGRIVDVLKHALEIEDRSVRYYREKRQEAADPATVEVLGSILAEENRHYSIIGDLLNYYLKPQLWNEQAEFTHLDQY